MPASGAQSSPRRIRTSGVSIAACHSVASWHDQLLNNTRCYLRLLNCLGISIVIMTFIILNVVGLLAGLVLISWIDRKCSALAWSITVFAVIPPFAVFWAQSCWLLGLKEGVGPVAFLPYMLALPGFGGFGVGALVAVITMDFYRAKRLGRGCHTWKKVGR
jgi:hypothetical protein